MLKIMLSLSTQHLSQIHLDVLMSKIYLVALNVLILIDRTYLDDVDMMLMMSMISMILSMNQHQISQMCSEDTVMIMTFTSDLKKWASSIHTSILRIMDQIILLILKERSTFMTFICLLISSKTSSVSRLMKLYVVISTNVCAA